ncbi:hypothetical protein, partial [Glaesserella parasuis]|uniref:hypothetical protein n=1 Tax=Glaesserella parasuis TaxID=738 RepID=UPI003F32AAC6
MEAVAPEGWVALESVALVMVSGMASTRKTRSVSLAPIHADDTCCRLNAMRAHLTSVCPSAEVDAFQHLPSSVVAFARELSARDLLTA